MRALRQVTVIVLIVLLTSPAPVAAQSGRGRDRIENDQTQVLDSRTGAGNLNLSTYLGDGSAEVYAQEVSARLMGEPGGEQQLWDPPAWLAACDIDVMSFADFVSQRSAIADHYRSQVNSRYLADDADWVVMGCTGEGARVVRGVPGSTLTWSGVAYPVGTAPPTPVIDWLIADALAKVRVPVQAGSSAPNGEDQPVFYQLETVAWVDPAVWQPVTASSQTFAASSGVQGTTVTVTATPRRATFEALPNNGEESSFADCGDWANEAWTPARDEALVAQGCTVTFGEAADDHILRSELTWGLAWSCSCNLSGNFNGQTIVRVNERPVEVLEYLVVES